MSKQIGAREISEYAQKYNMPLGKDTPLSMAWCFEMSDKAYQQGRTEAIDELRKIIMNCSFDYSVKIALDVLMDRVKEKRQ